MLKPTYPIEILVKMFLITIMLKFLLNKLKYIHAFVRCNEHSPARMKIVEGRGFDKFGSRTLNVSAHILLYSNLNL